MSICYVTLSHLLNMATIFYICFHLLLTIEKIVLESLLELADGSLHSKVCSNVNLGDLI